MRGNEYKALGKGPRLQQHPDDTTCKLTPKRRAHRPRRKRRDNRATIIFPHCNTTGTQQWSSDTRIMICFRWVWGHRDDHFLFCSTSSGRLFLSSSHALNPHLIGSYLLHRISGRFCRVVWLLSALAQAFFFYSLYLSKMPSMGLVSGASG